MSVTLCERFSGLTPLNIRLYRAHEVFLLIKRYNEYIENENKEKKKDKKGKRVIRRPAGDNWF